MIWVKAILVGFLIGLTGTWLVERRAPNRPPDAPGAFLSPRAEESALGRRWRNLLLMESERQTLRLPDAPQPA